MFQNPELDNMLAIGAVTSSSARVWARTAEAGEYGLRWQPADGGAPAGRAAIDLSDAARDHTGSIVIGEALAPDTRYRVELSSPSGETLASGRFRTTADTAAGAPDQYAFAVMSCHLPFDADGNVREASEQALEAAYQACLEHDVRYLVMAGDQLYADMPTALSLFDASHFARVAPPGRDSILACTEQEVRRLFHDRYRHFWSVPGWRRLMSEFSCYPILDDHEIVDNWGSAEAHQSEEWQPFRRGAFKAYCDYQHSLVHPPVTELPEHLDYSLETVDTATYVLDLRSNRRVGPGCRVFSEAQFEALSAFLRRHGSKSAVFLVLSVPIVHLPRRLSRLLAESTRDGEDFSDRWSTRGHGHDRDRLLQLLRRHQQAFPDQQVVLLSGDIHIGCLHQIRWRDRQPNLYQFVSSGISHDAGTVTQVLSSLIICANRRVLLEDGSRAQFRLVRGERGYRGNPCGRLNFGIVEVERSGSEQPRLRLLLYSHRGHRPWLRYRSPPVPLGHGSGAVDLTHESDVRAAQRERA